MLVKAFEDNVQCFFEERLGGWIHLCVTPSAWNKDDDRMPRRILSLTQRRDCHSLPRAIDESSHREGNHSRTDRNGQRCARACLDWLERPDEQWFAYDPSQCTENKHRSWTVFSAATRHVILRSNSARFSLLSIRLDSAQHCSAPPLIYLHDCHDPILRHFRMEGSKALIEIVTTREKDDDVERNREMNMVYFNCCMVIPVSSCAKAYRWWFSWTD